MCVGTASRQIAIEGFALEKKEAAPDVYAPRVGASGWVLFFLPFGEGVVSRLGFDALFFCTEVAQMSAELEVLQTVIWAGTWIVIALIFAPLVKYVVRRLLEVRELEIRSVAKTDTKKRPEED